MIANFFYQLFVYIFQDYEHRMAHHSGSRSDLLDHDHTAALYEHGLAYSNNQPYTFVRMCDGKFVRTTIPIHDFEALDSALASTGPTSTPYYRTSVNHTLRRPSKRVVHGTQDYTCCPRDELHGGQQTASGRSAQSYATLRGRKWVEKQRQACSSGVGDNFGRSVYLEDSRYSDTLWKFRIHLIRDIFLNLQQRSNWQPLSSLHVIFSAVTIGSKSVGSSLSTFVLMVW